MKLPEIIKSALEIREILKNKDSVQVKNASLTMAVDLFSDHFCIEHIEKSSGLYGYNTR